MVARLSGDEFVVVLDDVRRKSDLELIAQKLLNRLSLPVKLQGHSIISTASIGISVFPADGDNIDQLLKHADLAMHKAKAKGKTVLNFTKKPCTTRRLIIYCWKTTCAAPSTKVKLFCTTSRKLTSPTAAL